MLELQLLDVLPEDATTKLYSDMMEIVTPYWADENSELGSTVKLINTLRNSSSEYYSRKKLFSI